MKILQLAPRLPWPLTDGGAIGVFNITRGVAACGHEITFVSFPLAREVDTQKGIEAIRKYATVRLVDRQLPTRSVVFAKTVFRGAYPVERRMMPEMFTLLRELVERESFDLAHVDHSHMGKYGVWLKREYGIPFVLRQHNFEALIYERFVEREPNLLKRELIRVHGRRLRIAERKFLMEADAVIAISEDDRAEMHLEVPSAHIEVVPAGVDTDFFAPAINTIEESNTLLFVGGLDWEPNEDSLRYFLTDVFPDIVSKIPSVRLHVVGGGQCRLRLDNYPRVSANVTLHGRVEEIRDYFARAAVVVVPLRIGGGMRVKLLEFFAAGKAVVSTTIGAEGNVGQDGEHYLLRDDPGSFARAIVDLLGSESRRKELGINARKLAEHRYSWNATGLQMSSIYENVRRNVVGVGRAISEVHI